MNFKLNISISEIIFLLFNFLFIVFLSFYSFDFLLFHMNSLLSRFDIFSFYEICEKSFFLFKDSNQFYSYRFTDNLQCVGQVLNNSSTETFYVGVLSERLSNELKIILVTLDVLIFIMIFFTYIKNLIFTKIKKNKVISKNNSNTAKRVKSIVNLEKYFQNTSRVYILWTLLFINFIYLPFLQVIYSEIAFFHYSKLNFMTQVLLQIVLMIFFIMIFYLVSKLKDKNLVKFLFIFLLICYPISNTYFKNHYLVFLIAGVVSLLLIKLQYKENIKSLLFTFLFLLTVFNSFTTIGLFNHNIFDNRPRYVEAPNIKSDKAEGPILIMWFDEFPSYTIFNEDLDIRDEFRNLKNLSKESYIFPFNQALASSSYESLNLTFKEFEFNNKLIEDYDVKFIEPISNICPYLNCNYSKRLSNLQYMQDLIAILLNVLNYEFLSGFTPSIDDRFGDFWSENKQVYEDYWEVDFKTLNNLTMNISKDDFIFAHIFLPHTPWKYFSDGETYSIQPNNARSFFLEEKYVVLENNMYTTRYEWIKSFENYNYIIDESSRQINQVLYLDLLIGKIINNLKDQGLYDTATIIIASDHGINVSKEGAYRSLNDKNYVDILNTPLIIKTPLQSNNQKVLNIVGNNLISEYLKMVLNNTSIEQQLELLTKYNKQPNIQILAWDTLSSKSEKYEISDGYITLDQDIFIDQVRQNSKIITQVFDYIDDNYGWSDKLEIDVSSLNEINLNLSDMRLSEINKYFYLNFELDTNDKRLLVVIDNQFKYVDTYIHNNKTQITFLLNEPVSLTSLENIKIYELKN